MFKNDKAVDLFRGRKGGGRFRPITLEKNYFELGVGGEGQDTSRHFDGGFGSMRAISPLWGLRVKMEPKTNIELKL